MKVVDLFAGYGGFSTGASQAGATVAYAANHWEHAVETHALNHPRTKHECQDLRQADFSKLPYHDMLLAAPSCQGNSTAARAARKRSEKVRATHDEYRSTALAVIDCAEVCRPKALLVENVEQFSQWTLFDLWCSMLERLGYKLTIKKLWANRLGVPQRRQRLFIAGSLDCRPDLDFAPEPEIPFGPCIQWDDGPWRPWRKSQRRARERIAKAQQRHGKRFLTQHVTNHPGVSLDEPIRTITTKDQWGVVDGDMYRPLTKTEIGRAMGFPDDYQTNARTRQEWMRGYGNAVPPPVAARLVTRMADYAMRGAA